VLLRTSRESWEVVFFWAFVLRHSLTHAVSFETSECKLAFDAECRSTPRPSAMLGRGTRLHRLRPERTDAMGKPASPRAPRRLLARQRKYVAGDLSMA